MNFYQPIEVMFHYFHFIIFLLKDYYTVNMNIRIQNLQRKCKRHKYPNFKSFCSFITILYHFRVNVIYIDKNGKEIPIKGKIGDNLMYLAHRHGIEMEGKPEINNEPLNVIFNINN